MKKIRNAILLFALFAGVGHGQNTSIGKETMTLAQVARMLVDLQPKDPSEYGQGLRRLTVVAASLHPSLVTVAAAMAHGWCENPGFLSCSPAHHPIPVRVITGDAVKEPWRWVAEDRVDALPGAWFGRRGEVYLNKSAPSRTVWMLEHPGGDKLIVGDALNANGTGDVTVVTGPKLVQAMLKQLFIDEVMRSAKRWLP